MVGTNPELGKVTRMFFIELPWPDEDPGPDTKRLDAGAGETIRQVGEDCSSIFDSNSNDRIPFEIFFCPPDESEYTLYDMHERSLDYINGICLSFKIPYRVFAPQLQDWGPVVKGGRVLVVIGGDIIPKIGADALDHYEGLFTKRTVTEPPQ